MSLEDNPRQPPNRTLPDPARFLIVDDHAEGRFLLSKSLLRKYPNARVIECRSAVAAFDLLRTESVDVVIAHRTIEHDPVSLVGALRERSGTVPIVMVSGIDRSAAALEVGATAFLHYDQWLLIGSLIAELRAKAS